MYCILQYDKDENEKIIRIVNEESEFVDIIKTLTKDLSDMVIIDNSSEEYSSTFYKLMLGATCYSPGLYLVIYNKQIVLIDKLDSLDLLLTWKLLVIEQKELIEEPPIKLYQLLQKIKSGGNSDEDTILFLTDIFFMCKGDDYIKGYVGKHINGQIIHLLLSENVKIVTITSKILRTIMINKENKNIFIKYCVDILTILKLKMDNCDISIPLMAVIWSLSAVFNSRKTLINHSVIHIMDQVLFFSYITTRSELQIETLGAIRNFTLDFNFASHITKTNIINTLILILKSTNEPKIISNILNSLRNLSTNTPTSHSQITDNGIGIYILISKINKEREEKDLHYIAEIFTNILRNDVEVSILMKLGSFRKIISRLKMVTGREEEFLLRLFKKILDD
jgi:hypothetical protein